MKAKILLTGLVAPMVFAACTQEEVFVPQQEAGKIDLSNRPTLGKVTLGFDSQTRATLNDEGYFNSLKWTDTDAVGARIIDKPKDGYKFGSKVYPFFGYDIATYASTNYKFEKSAGSEWTTDALMIEGNYMFYAPYNEKALYRDPLKMTFPTVQNINPASEINEKADANTDAIKEFFESENTYVVGYKFLAAEGQEKIVSPTMTHIYAYPQITLKNAYTVSEGDPAVDVAKPITIDSIVFSSGNFYKDYTIKQQGLVGALKDAYAKVADVKDAKGNVIKEGLADPDPAGAWNDATSLLKNALTKDIATGSNGTSITVKFTEPLTIDAEGEFKFHMVMPAEKYDAGDFKAVVYLSGQKSFIVSGGAKEFKNGVALTYAPGKRYAKQEYNFPAEGGYEIKDATAGDLATFTLEGVVDTYIAPTYISSAEDFEDYLKALNNNEAVVVENGDGGFKLQKDADGKPLMEIDATIVALRNKYLSKGSITFESEMTVSGDITLDKNFIFNGKLNQKSGNLTLKSKVAGNATFNGAVTLDGATLEGTASFKAATITSADIKGAIEFNGNATVKTLTSATNATVKSGVVTIEKSSNAALEIAIEGGEVKLNKANYGKKITVGTTKDSGTKADKAGTLTIGEENELTKVFFNNGTVNINAKVSGVGDSYFSANWKFGTLKVNNNGTIDASSFTNKAKIVNNGTILAKVTNLAGSIIENNTTMTVASNEGNIVVAEGSSTYVEAGSAAGEIDNTNGGALFLTGCDNTVSYTFSTLQTTEDIENFDAVLYGVNKVIFNAGINFNKKFEDMTKVFYGVNIIDINGGTITIAPNVAMPANAKVMNITGNVTIDGFKKDVSQLAITNKAGDGTKINVAKNAVLKIKEVSMGAGLTTGKLIFDLAAPTAAEAAANVKAGAIVLENANLYVGTTGDVPAVTKDAYSATGKMYWDFATPTASWKN